MSIDPYKLLQSKLTDAVKLSVTKNIPSFLGFLSEHEFSFCKSYLDRNNVKYIFSGGHVQAVRLYIAILPDWTDNADFPFKCLKFTYKNTFSLSHRDFLGTLMSLGIERDKVGDILVKNGEAFVFIYDKIIEFCKLNISKVGGVGVEICEYCGEIEAEQRFEVERKVIASARADCVVGAICNISREKAKDFILGKNLIVNHIICESITLKIKNHDVLSVRGKGKFIVESLNDKTHKGRLILQLKKYL